MKQTMGFFFFFLCLLAFEDWLGRVLDLNKDLQEEKK